MLTYRRKLNEKDIKEEFITCYLSSSWFSRSYTFLDSAS
uniref:Uncharacterized protein n=1 Tax=Pfiesteria piscicida TaxID=71001 RepID=E8Z6G6_PFIPI|nr:unknown [Pfiesteria piscicida]